MGPVDTHLSVSRDALKSCGLRLEEVREEFVGLDAVCRIVRAGVDAAWLREVVAKIAGGRLAHHRFRRRADAALLHDLLQVDVAIGAVSGAESATDAPVFDDD